MSAVSMNVSEIHHGTVRMYGKVAFIFIAQEEEEQEEVLCLYQPEVRRSEVIDVVLDPAHWIFG